ncbi:enoyl-CoA hydratase [Gordonia sp. NPDC003429]
MSSAAIPAPLRPDDLGPDTSPVAYEVGGPGDAVAYVTLNRPEYRNAQNSVMTYSLDAAFRRAVDDAAVKVIVLRANGKHFSAGHDIGTPERDVDTFYENVAALHWDHTDKSGGDQRLARETEVYLGMCRRWRDIPKPMIAQVHGACIAGGLMLAWSCDFIVASDDAFFSDPVARMGIPGVEYFAHAFVLGPRRAKEILFTGQRFSAAQAADWGMVNHVVEREGLAAKVDAIAEQMVAMPMQGLFLSKKAVNICEDQMGLRNAMDSVFGWHHFAHSANAEASGGDSLGGMNAGSMKSAATPPAATPTTATSTATRS